MEMKERKNRRGHLTKDNKVLVICLPLSPLYLAKSILLLHDLSSMQAWI